MALVTIESAWWLLIAWHSFGARPSTITMMVWVIYGQEGPVDTVACYKGAKLHMRQELFEFHLNISIFLYQYGEICWEITIFWIVFLAMNINIWYENFLFEIWHVTLELLYTLSVINVMYCQTSNIRCTSAGNRIVGHSDVVGASPVGAAPTTSSFPS